jgi:CRISPR-associated protein Csb1
LVASTIRAFNARPLTRGAVYIPPVDYAALDVFTEEEKAKAEGDQKNPLAQRGFVHVPASGTHGGVIADGGIRRDATLGLAALRLLQAGNDRAKTLTLQRYILGLALVAFTYRPLGYLRQGCMLVLDPNKKPEFAEVYPDGTRHECRITHEQALAYAEGAAKAFGEVKGKTVTFDKEKAKADVAEGADKGRAKKAGKSKGKAENDNA